MKGWLWKWTSLVFLTIAITIQIQFVFSLWTGTLNFLFYDTRYLVGQAADFFSYYQAGHNILNGIGCYTIPDPLAVPYLYPYRYLPYFAYTFGVVVNLAPPITAYWLWVALLVGFVWLAALRTRSLAKALNRPNWEGYIGMGIWFMFSPIYIELFVGQVTLMAAVFVFFALTTHSLVDGRKERGTMTIFWIAGSLTKVIPYFIAPVLLAAGRVRTVLVAVMVTVLAIVAVPAGLEALRFFLDFNAARATYVTPYIGDHSLKMLLYYVLGEPGTDFRVITGLLIGIFFGLATCATFYSRDVWSCAGLFSTSYFFIMLDVWEHHYTFLLPFLVLAWFRARPGEKKRWIPFALALLMSIPMLPIVQVLSGLGSGVHPITLGIEWQIIYHSSKVVPALIFFGWLLMMAFRSPRAENGREIILDTFRNAWNGLKTGSNPRIEEGILVREEIEKEGETQLEI